MKPPRRNELETGGRTTVLVTGFGPFPGVPVNATMRLLPELAQVVPKLFPDVRFVFEVLRTEWVAGPQRLLLILDELRPDLALHFGVSSRARGFEIESRARNVCAATPDASGALPVGATVSDHVAGHLPVGLPVRYIVASLRRLGIPAYVSRDAGTYLCNATLYHSLAFARGAAASVRHVGFVHVPATLARPGGSNRGRSGACPLTWEQAVVGAVQILAVSLGRPSALQTM